MINLARILLPKNTPNCLAMKGVAKNMDNLVQYHQSFFKATGKTRDREFVVEVQADETLDLSFSLVVVVFDSLESLLRRYQERYPADPAVEVVESLRTCSFT